MADQTTEKAPEAASAAAPPATDPASTAPSAIQPPTVSHWTQPDHEDESDDGDSALGDNSSSTASLSASILEYRQIHGRRFHAQRGETEYWGPNDERQNDSMDVSHHVYTLLFDGKLHLAPLSESLAKVLDVGTGTGVWTIDFADLHPEAEVIGIDISPTQPAWVPPNCKFEVDDATLPWTFQQDSFDYIHVRSLIGSIADWNALFKEAFKATKPGGWVESFEITINFTSDDGSIIPGMALYEWGPLFFEVGRKTGRSLEVVENGLVSTAFNAAGFVDIVSTKKKLPVTGYAQDGKLRQIGIFNHLAIDQGLEGYSIYLLTQVMGWKPEQVHLLVARVRKELRSKKVHPNIQVEVIYGRKPENV